MRILLAVLFVATLTACGGGTEKPDEVSRTIVENFKGCMPGLRAADVKRNSDRRYYIITDKYATAWRVHKNENGTISTAAWDADEAKKFASWGCYD